MKRLALIALFFVVAGIVLGASVEEDTNMRRDSAKAEIASAEALAPGQIQTATFALG